MNNKHNKIVKHRKISENQKKVISIVCTKMPQRKKIKLNPLSLLILKYQYTKFLSFPS